MRSLSAPSGEEPTTARPTRIPTAEAQTDTREKHTPRRSPADTIEGVLQHYLPAPAAERAVVAHQKIVRVLESEEGRKIVLPVLLGVLVLLLFMLIFVIL